ncbi:MAG: PorP/SprF family type IX secretion system membrane protein [Bacteroidota bacterium]
MKFCKILLLICAIFFTGQLRAQDIHYTLFNYSPILLNPANTGAFEGTFRIGGIYRDQWGSVLSSQFQTPSFYVDAPIIRGFKKTHWVGVGGTMFSDKAGALNLSNNAFLGSVAYHIGLNKKMTSAFTIGVQAGMRQRRLDVMNAIWGDALQDLADSGGMSTGFMSPDETRVGDNSSFFDLSAGVLYRSAGPKQTDITIGVSVNHILTPNYSFINQNDSRVGNNPDSIAVDFPMRITAHGELTFDLNKKWDLSPTFLINQITNMNELSLQVWAGYKLKPEEDIKLRFGTGYRIGDAAKVLVGMDYKAFRAAAAYDVNISQLSSQTNTVGGFEIAVSYIAKIFKDPEIKPAIFCPRL